MKGFSFETQSEDEKSFNEEFDTGTAIGLTAGQDQGQVATTAAAEELVGGLEEEQRQHDEIHKAMSEVEKRLELAECYKALLQQELFDSRTHASVTVQKEVADFCRRRLENLMGLRSEATVSTPQVGLPFTKEEFAALKALAQAALRRPGIVASRREDSAPPTVKPAPVPTQSPQVQQRPPAAVRPVAIRTPTSPQAPPRPAGARKKIREIQHPDTGKTVKIDVTPQVGLAKNPHALPMPDKATMEMITQHDAMKSVAAAGKNLPALIQAGIAHSINQPPKEEE